ncbi:hypothetical protein ACEUAX_12805 [Aeromonas veronii]
MSRITRCFRALHKDFAMLVYLFQGWDMVHVFDFKGKTAQKRDVVQVQQADTQMLQVSNSSQVIELVFENKRRERAKRNLLRAAAKLNW